LVCGGVSAARDGDDFRARVAEAAVAAPKNLRRDIDILVSLFVEQFVLNPDLNPDLNLIHAAGHLKRITIMAKTMCRSRKPPSKNELPLPAIAMKSDSK
jgi:hypothetical protein